MTIAHEVFSATAASIAAGRAEQRAREVLRRARLAAMDGIMDPKDLASPAGAAFDAVHDAGVDLTIAQSTRDGGRALAEATRRLLVACGEMDALLPALDAKGKR